MPCPENEKHSLLSELQMIPASYDKQVVLGETASKIASDIGKPIAEYFPNNTIQ